MRFAFLLAFLIEAVIFEVFAHRLYRPRVNLPLRCLIYCALYGTLFLVHSPYHVYRNIALDVVAGIIVFCVVYRAPVPIGIFNSLMLVSLNFISELLVSNMISHYDNDFWVTWKLSGSYILTLTSRLLFFAISMLIARLQRNNSGNTLRGISEHIASTGVVICTMILLCILSVFIYSMPYSRRTEILFYVALGVLLIAFALILLWYQLMQKRYSEYSELQLQLQRVKDSAEHYSYIEQKDTELRILVHDIKNHLQSISSLDNANDSGEYVSGLLERIEEANPAKICENQFVSAIVNRYRLLARRNCISFTHDIRDVNLDFIDKLDLTSILCNLLDNAFEGCNTDNPFVDLSVYSDGNTGIVITTVNSCPNEPRKNRFGRFISTKDGSELHGLGIRSITNSAAKYDGNASFFYKSEDSTFHAIVMLTGGCN